MLVLTRMQGERIQIGRNIRLTVLEMKRNTVRLGIEAPSDIEIIREDLVEKKRRMVCEYSLPRS